MTTEDSITIRIGGSLRQRWAATLAVIRRFRVHFVGVVCLWLVLGALSHQLALHIELAAAVLIASAVCNILGIDPGQLVIRGSVTFTPLRVCQLNLLGRTKERGWDWVLKAEEIRGNLHVVLGPHRSRAVLLRTSENSADYQALRALLIAKGKLQPKGS